MKNVLKTLLYGAAALTAASCTPDAGPRISDYDVVWDTPSKDASGAMPLGNGELGVNLWVEGDGDMLFYLSRTDTWSETGRPLKVGRVRVSLSPNPFVSGAPFSQRLNLQEGSIEIQAGPKGEQVRLAIFADPNDPVLHITGSADRPVTVAATTEIWRTEPYNVPERDSALNYGTEWPRGAEFNPAVVIESADRTASYADAVIWFHRNEHSVYDATLEHMELASLRDSLADPLFHRTFGAHMSGEGFVRASDVAVATAEPRKKFELQLAVHTAQTPTAEAWVAQVTDLAARAAGAAEAQKAARAWWKDFWNRSWIEVETPNDESGFQITQSYILQNWISAGSGRGNYPIKFNGSIFTVDPRFTKADKDGNPDFRYWGGQYWWQNTRLPYYPMLAGGQFEMMQPVFKFYQDLLPTFRTVAREFWDADGAVIPETASILGLYRNPDYGWFRKELGLKKGEIKNMYIRHEWNGSLELVAMMLDYYDYTGDPAFAREQLLPMADNVLRYFDSRFPKDERGVMRITPTQSLETYWYGVVNDMPCVAGLHNVLPRLSALPAELTTEGQRDMWKRMTTSLPPVPVGEVDGETRFLPAGEYENRTNNSEIPEMYTVFPYYLCHLDTPDRQVGIDSYHARKFRGPEGWRQDGQMAAILGLTDEVRENLLAKIANSNENHRFPAIWGPNFDWTPDQDHGGNLLTTLQTMVVQSYGDKVYVLPAFPADWNVRFKLRVRGGGTIEGTYRDGAWKKAPAVKGAQPEIITLIP